MLERVTHLHSNLSARPPKVISVVAMLRPPLRHTLAESLPTPAMVCVSVALIKAVVSGSNLARGLGENLHAAEEVTRKSEREMQAVEFEK